MSSIKRTITGDHGTSAASSARASLASRLTLGCCFLLLGLPALLGQTQAWIPMTHGVPGSYGLPQFSATLPTLGETLQVSVQAAAPTASAYLVIGGTSANLQIGPAVLLPSPDLVLPAAVSPNGGASWAIPVPNHPALLILLRAQIVVPDPTAPAAVAFSAGYQCPVGPAAFGFYPPTLSASASGVAIAAGRINANNNRDFVLARETADQIKIKLGDGAGAFPGTQNWTMGNGPTDVAIADFNGDGYRDVIATNSNSNRVRIRWGAAMGNGAFASWNSPIVGNGPTYLAAGDLNGDGLADFVTANVGDSSLTVRLRMASGGFTSTTYPTRPGLTDVQIGDVDGDGDRDLIYADGDGALSNVALRLRRNNGNGQFTFVPINIPVPTSGHAISSITLGDFNEDGDLDIVAAHMTAGELVELLGNGNGTFGAPVIATVGAFPRRIYSRDMNGDGFRDLVVAHHISDNNNVVIYRGQGDGNFVGPIQFDVSGFAYDLGIADFNHDGHRDIVVTTTTGTYTLLAH